MSVWCLAWVLVIPFAALAARWVRRGWGDDPAVALLAGIGLAVSVGLFARRRVARVAWGAAVAVACGYLAGGAFTLVEGGPRPTAPNQTALAAVGVLLGGVQIALTGWSETRRWCGVSSHRWLG